MITCVLTGKKIMMIVKWRLILYASDVQSVMKVKVKDNNNRMAIGYSVSELNSDNGESITDHECLFINKR